MLSLWSRVPSNSSLGGQDVGDLRNRIREARNSLQPSNAGNVAPPDAEVKVSLARPGRFKLPESACSLASWQCCSHMAEKHMGAGGERAASPDQGTVSSAQL